MVRYETFVESGQNLIDLVIQCYGSLDYAIKLLKENNLPNLNVNLEVGQRIVFEPLPQNTREYPLHKATQDFFLSRKLRVRTGEAVYAPVLNCVIPDGYGLLQFSIEYVPKNQVWYLDLLNQGCPQESYFDGLQNVASEIFTPPNSHNTQVIAMYFVQWLNNVSVWGASGVYAVSTTNIVSMYVPLSLVACGSEMGFCPYERGKRGENGIQNFVPATGKPTIQFAIQTDALHGILACCDSQSTNATFSNYNQWQYQEIR